MFYKPILSQKNLLKRCIPKNLSANRVGSNFVNSDFMRKKLKFLLLACVWLTLGSSYAQERAFNQKKASQVHHLGLSLPMIWNNSSAVFYQIGRKEPEGSALSYGINLNYSRTIHRNLFGTLGIGYFKQVFGIRRPFDYDTGGPQPLIYSKSYAYHSFHFLAGLGYQQNLGEKFALKGQLTYNTYRSFRQRYTPTTTAFGGNQVNKNSLNIGRMANLQLDLERRLSSKLSLGMGLIIPVWVEWQNDETFFEPLGYAEDENQIAYNKFSIGTHFFCNYHF